MDAQADVQSLIRKRGVIKAQLTRFKKWLSSIPKDEVSAELLQIPFRLETIKPLLSEFNAIQFQIEASQTELDDAEANALERDSFEESYYKHISIANDMILKGQGQGQSNRSSSQSTASVHQNSNLESQIKLPTINLPSFYGDHVNWLEFRDTFHSLIHTNNSISNIQKFHYLKASVKGEASSVLQSLQLCDANYPIAWNALLERYDNKRLIVHNLIKSLFHLPNIQKESHALLRQLLDGVSKNLRSLKTLGQPVEHWDTLLIYIIVNKLDIISKREWEAQRFGADFPTINDLKDFLKFRCETLETLNFSQTNNAVGNTNSKPNLQKPKHNYSSNALVSSVSNNHTCCAFCKQQHSIYECQGFKNLSVENRTAEVKNRKLCINCLKGSHYSKVCRSSRCRICGRKHNTLLHLNNTKAPSENSGNNATDSQVNTSMLTEPIVNEELVVNHAIADNKNQILLSTAVVKVRDDKGDLHNCRALLDSGSQSNFISEILADKLGLKKTKINLRISGISQLSTKITHITEIQFYSIYDNYQASISCIVVPQITGNIPSFTFDISQLAIPHNIKLADTALNISDKVDLLIGSEIFYHLLCAGQIKRSDEGFIIQKTRLGWVVAGPLNPLCCANNDTNHQSIYCNASINHEFERDIRDGLARFWELEECPKEKALLPEEKMCEESFIENTGRDTHGRFIVTLPLKESPKRLGNSLDAAIVRFRSLERKFTKNPEFKQQYVNFMREYEALGHMSKLKNADTGAIRYYLPHHGVVKEDSLTTKLRVVFDGSAKSDSGTSINDLQMVGPVLQDDLFSILIRFRKHKIAIASDVAKMYRQILIQEEQRDLQRILWRENPSDPLNHFTLNTVTYGTAAASFLSIRCLQQLAHDNAAKYPKSSSVILRDFYVDDLLTGADTVEDVLKVRKEVTEILQQGCFELRKWVSNIPEILNEVDSATNSNVLRLGPLDNTKTLGLIWLPIMDNIGYNIQASENTTSVTKRQILSRIAKIYDPLGLLGPCIIGPKIILQKLWQYKLTWDESIPLDLHTQWLRFQNELDNLSSIQIPRCALISNTVTIQIHGFSDASQAAYGACLYLRSSDDLGNVCVRLLCAKSKIAPVKHLSIPRLELCGTLLLSKLLTKVKSAINLTFENINYWCDSMVVIAWIKAPTNQLKPFVSNRVAEIQDSTSDGTWRYVASRDNPADLLTRGISPKALLNNTLWWEGPAWLLNTSEDWPAAGLIESQNSPQYCNEVRTQTITMVTLKSEFTTFHKFSSLSKLQRCLAYCLRFKNNALAPKHTRKFDNLSPEELNKSLKTLVKIAQQEAFAKEILDLKETGSVNSKSKLLALNPFLDEHGIMRVGGRLRYSSFSLDKRHPYLIPRDHRITLLIMQNEHSRLLHCGPQALLASIRERFWPISGRNIAKKIIRNCVTCFRVNPRTNEELMGPLPKERVTATFPFNFVGVDYCGPILIKNHAGRGCRSVKSYICIFICLAVKAIHLELVTDLTTEAFLASLKRFVSRRGKPSKIYSDNGTNFVGADAELKRFIRELSLKPKKGVFNDALASEGIQWHFIPPRSPHFGGCWERGVRSVKFHLRRVIGNALLTYEQLYTVLTQIEAVVNSRPLSPLSSDPNDYNPLTPSHFLIGRSLVGIPESSLTEIKENRLSQFQRCVKITQHFWSRWSKEYICELQRRTKWQLKNPRPPLVGDMVIIKDENASPLKWHLGRIAEVFPGRDNVIRVASVKTNGGTIKRAMSKLCILPIDSDNN